MHDGSFVWADNTNADFVSTAPNQFLIRSAGGVGINLNNPSNVLTLPNLANSNGRGLANAWSIYSSRRWKEDIHLIENPLDLVARLEGVRYKWKANGQSDIGLIAEDVGKVIPEIVAYEVNGVDAQSVDYARLVAVLIEAVKELKEDNAKQNNEIERLKAAIQP